VNSRLVAGVLVLEVVLLCPIVVLALDMRAHSRVEHLGGVNVWGYRGAVMHEKRADETRIALVGGDLAFGWGVAPSETMPYSVRQVVALALDRRGGPQRRFTAVNLAARALDRSEYAAWIARFAYLRPDVICIMPDPRWHRPSGDRFLPDRRSRLFAAFGYSPILPLVLREKGEITRSAALRSIGTLLAHMDPDEPSNAAGPLQRDDDALGGAIRAALRAASVGVVVVLPPGNDIDLAPAAADRRVRIVNLNEVELPAGEMTLDGFDFSVAGHTWAADAVTPAVLDLIHASEAAR
jgi:hypothetical protein